MSYLLITGANGGLGRLCKKRFERDYDIIAMNGKDTCNLNNTLKLQEYLSSLKDKDITKIIHCAGGGLGYKDTLIEFYQFEELFRVNLLAPSMINNAFLPNMIKKKEGNIIHISSIAGIQACSSIGYSSIKSGLLAYNRILGREMAKYGIVVSCIVPGSFVAPDNNWYKYKKENKPWFNKYIQTLPRHRLDDGEDLLPLIEMLLDKESTIFCGCVLHADGGQGVTYD